MKPKPDLQKAIKIVGRKPVNPVGQCFESAIRQVLFGKNPPRWLTLCHGIGIANMPGQEGRLMGHAWVEWNDSVVRVAMDTTWGAIEPALRYRKEFQLQYVVEYTPEQARLLWEIHDMPGPWDSKIRAITDGKGEA